MGRAAISGRAAIAIAAAAVVVAGCGGEDDVDPNALLDAAFAKPIPSSRIEAELDANIAGIATLEGLPIRVTVDGPYVSGEGVRIPSVNWDVDASLGGFGAGANVISTGDNAFVRFFGETFEVGAETVAAQNPQLLGDLGIRPREWFGRATFESDEEVAGTDTRHIRAELEARRLLEDLDAVADELGLSGGVVRDITSSSLDIWAGKDDDIVRQLRVQLEFRIAPDRGDEIGGATGGDLKLNVILAEVGEEQRIAAPPPPYEPIDQLPDRLPPIPGISTG